MKRFLVAVCISACLIALATGTASASTNFVYDLYVTPGVFPQNPPWTTQAGFVNGSDSQSVSGSLLTLVDGPENTDPGYYYDRNLVSDGISSNSQYEIRSRVRLSDWGSLNASEPPVFMARFLDGNAFVGFGMTLTNGQTQTFLCANGCTATQFSPYNIIPLGNDDFFNVHLRKIGTTGTSADTVELYVNGSFVDSTTHGNFVGAFGGAKEFLFGTASSPAFGRVELTGLSFGIGETAPALLPEPSGMGLVAITALCALRRFRARG
jgi:hypothetical protein